MLLATGLGHFRWCLGSGVATHLFGERPELFGVDMRPYPLHVVPVRHDSVLHRVAVDPFTVSRARFDTIYIGLEGRGRDARELT